MLVILGNSEALWVLQEGWDFHGTPALLARGAMLLPLAFRPLCRVALLQHYPCYFGGDKVKRDFFAGASRVREPDESFRVPFFLIAATDVGHIYVEFLGIEGGIRSVPILDDYSVVSFGQFDPPPLVPLGVNALRGGSNNASE